MYSLSPDISYEQMEKVACMPQMNPSTYLVDETS